MAADDTCVFGYGSLVSRASIARTIGREVESDDGFRTARLHGFGRRWNYGSPYQRGDWHGPHGRVDDGVVICLGLEERADERCNGAVVRVTDDELARLDWRERDYDRVDVTDLVEVDVTDVVGADHDRYAGRIVTYVPRPSATERYRAAWAVGRAAVERRYHLLVEQAFHALGDHHLDEYRRGTPQPDVPIVDFVA